MDIHYSIVEEAKISYNFSWKKTDYNFLPYFSTPIWYIVINFLSTLFFIM